MAKIIIAASHNSQQQQCYSVISAPNFVLIVICLQHYTFHARSHFYVTKYFIVQYMNWIALLITFIHFIPLSIFWICKSYQFFFSFYITQIIVWSHSSISYIILWSIK